MTSSGRSSKLSSDSCAPRVFETTSSFKELWAGPQRVFLWAEADSPEELRELRHYELARRGGKIIFTNQPFDPSGAR